MGHSRTWNTGDENFSAIDLVCGKGMQQGKLFRGLIGDALNTENLSFGHKMA